MSDAGRKMDVEDVLSSIRRLVSEEARTIVDKKIPTVLPTEASATKLAEPMGMPEKLVLTTAFRVAKDTPPEEPPQLPEADIRQDTPDAVEPEEAQQPEVVVDELVTEIQKSVEAPFTEAVEAKQTPALEQTPVIAEVKLEDVAPEPEPETPAKEAPMTLDAETLPEAEVTPEVEPTRIQEAPIEIEAPDNGYDAVDYTAEPADTFLDEEALRELVSEMVRSELQGELGDRITRNVRKLVRREIHRALASRDFN